MKGRTIFLIFPKTLNLFYGVLNTIVSNILNKTGSVHNVTLRCVHFTVVSVEKQ